MAPKILVAALLLLALLGTAVAQFDPASPTCVADAQTSSTFLSQERNRAAPPARKVIVQGAGASFPLRLYQDAIFAYQFQNQSVQVSYQSTGSGRGKCRIKDYWAECANVCTLGGTDATDPVYVDFAGSDSVLVDAEFTAYSDLQSYPAVAGAVVPIYNLPGLDALNHTLVLDKQVISRIFRQCDFSLVSEPYWVDRIAATGNSYTCESGSIATWDHPAIRALNEVNGDAAKTASIVSALIAAGRIELVIRSDGSGTSEIFKTALAAFEPEFGTQVGTSSSNADWFAYVSRHDTNVGVAGYVAGTPSTIGYSVLGEALTTGITFASLQNEVGALPVQANTVTVGNAMVEKGLNFGITETEQERLIADISNAGGSQAWPIVGYTYFVVRRDTKRRGAECDNVYATQAFFLWFYTDPVPQGIARSLGFAPLAETVRDIVVARVQADMRCDGELVFIPPLLDAPEVSLVGALAAAPIFAQYERSYAVLSPGVPFTEFQQRSVDAALADVSPGTGGAESAARMAVTLPPRSAEARAMVASNELIHIPFVAVGLGAVVNFCSSGQDDEATPFCTDESVRQVNMTEALLGRILSGVVTSWDDTEITALNPGLVAAGSLTQPIVVIGTRVRDELQARFEELIAQRGNLPGFQVAPTVTKETSDGQRTALATTPFSIGYVPAVGDALLRTASFVRIIKGARRLDPASNSREALAACAVPAAYDAETGVMDLQRAAAEVEGCYPLVESLGVTVRRRFEGAADCNEGKGQGEVLAAFLGFLFTNVLQEGLDNSVEEPLRTQTLEPLSTLPFTLKDNLARLDSITCNGISLFAPEEDKSLIPEGLIIFSVVLVGLLLGFVLTLIGWTYRNRRQKIVLIASPPFLQQILVGAVISLCTIVPLALQDDGLFFASNEDGSTPELDAACQAAPILFSVGTAVLYSSLWLKTWRLGKIFDNPKLRRIFITNRRMQAYQLLMLLVIVLLNVLWLVIDPLKWERVVLATDVNGNVLESYGRCYSENSLPLLMPLAGLLVISLAYGIWLIYKSRRIPSEYGESRYIGFALVTAFEALILGLPILFIAGNNPTASFLIKLTLVLATSITTVLFLFMPKVYHVWSSGWMTGTGSGSDSENANGTFSDSSGSLRKNASGGVAPGNARRDDARMQSASFVDSFRDHTRSFVEAPEFKFDKYDEDTV